VLNEIRAVESVAKLLRILEAMETVHRPDELRPIAGSRHS
jgi:hypothetical protein